jgi:hypothetical protein
MQNFPDNAYIEQEIYLINKHILKLSKLLKDKTV